MLIPKLLLSIAMVAGKAKLNNARSALFAENILERKDVECFTNVLQ